MAVQLDADKYSRGFRANLLYLFDALLALDFMVPFFGQGKIFSELRDEEIKTFVLTKSFLR